MYSNKTILVVGDTRSIGQMSVKKIDTNQLQENNCPI